MKPLLKKYLALGIAVQFIIAGIVDFGGFLFTEIFKQMGAALPPLTVIVITIRHWAFVWPLAVLLLMIALFHKERTDRIVMHLFGGLMLAAIVIVIILMASFVLPFCAISTALGCNTVG